MRGVDEEEEEVQAVLELTVNADVIALDYQMLHYCTTLPLRNMHPTASCARALVHFKKKNKKSNIAHQSRFRYCNMDCKNVKKNVVVNMETTNYYPSLTPDFQ